MKRAFLLIVIPALLVALGFAQTPAASISTDQTNIKGCLGGSDGNYTVVQDNTGHTFKITSSGVDLKAHLGHDVTLIGHRASGTSPAAADNSFAVTELTMISEHCAAAAPAATVSTPPETAVTPPAAAAGPVATTSALPETAITPAAPATAPAATVTTPPETAVTPAPSATPPAETVVTPPVAPAAPVAAASTVSDKPAADAAPPTRRPERLRSLSAAPAAAAVAPPTTASKSSERASTPDAAVTTPAAPVSSSSETVNTTPQAATTTPAAPARHGALWLLIAFAVLVIVLGVFVPFLSRWRRQKSLARSGAPNLSFTREASSDQDKSDPKGPRKAA